MTYMSPLLQNKINNNPFSKGSANKEHDNYYENLARNTAHAVKPNEAKARLVKDTPVTCIKDIGKDCVNFKKVVKTGEISDNNLGRINDLGLKIGSGLIATYLAAHANTKTDAIMKFVGGGAFLASMSLWPKLAINTPMKLMHKVNPGQRYVSAQGDKKDFFLDNQFILWDAAGITDEKEQRRQQKAALQARTLNLATVGVATPLMTSLAGNAIQPKIYDGVVKYGVKKVDKTIADEASLVKYLDKAKPQFQNVKEVDSLFESYVTAGKNVDDSLFKDLSDLLNIKNIGTSFKDSDDLTPITKMRSTKLIEQLKSLHDTTATVETDSLTEALKDVQLARKIEKKNSKMLIGKKSAASEAKKSAVMTKEEISTIISDLAGNKTVQNVKKVLKEKGLTEKQIDSVVQKTKVDSKEFFDTISTYNKEVLPKLRGRAKAYLDLLNPIVGSKYESAYTKEFQDTMGSLIKNLGVDYNTLKEVKGKDINHASEVLSKLFATKIENVDFGSDEYKDLISRLTNGATPFKTNATVGKLNQAENISKVTSVEGLEDITKAIFGANDKKGGFANAISKFIDIKKIDLQATKVKPAICANFEARLKKGDFAELGEEGIKIAKQIIYDGNSSVRENAAYAHNKNLYNKVVSAVLNPDAFNAEEEVIPGIKKFVSDLKQYDGSGTAIQKYFKTGSMSKLFKDSATSMYNSKSWLKKFGKMAIILTAATLLIQPFFGNVKKEFSKNNEKESAGGK